MGLKVVLVGGVEHRCWSEALEPFLEIWGLADTEESAMVEEGSGW